MDTNTMTWEIIKIASTAILSFVTGYVLFILNKKKDGKEISYDVRIIRGLLEIKDIIKNDIQILFKNSPTDNLTYIELDIYNSGNHVIKNQEIRLECPNNNKILEIIFEPQIEPELHFEEFPMTNLNERKIRIGHFEKNQRIGIRLIVAGENTDIKLHPYNPEGNVIFNSKSVNKNMDEKEKVIYFVTLLILFLILPSTFTWIVPGELGNMFGGFIKLILVVFIVKHIDVIGIIINKLFDSGKRYPVNINTGNESKSEIYIK